MRRHHRSPDSIQLVFGWSIFSEFFDFRDDRIFDLLEFFDLEQLSRYNPPLLADCVASHLEEFLAEK
jgi:hypothetical protein